MAISIKIIVYHNGQLEYQTSKLLQIQLKLNLDSCEYKSISSREFVIKNYIRQVHTFNLDLILNRLNQIIVSNSLHRIIFAKSYNNIFFFSNFKKVFQSYRTYFALSFSSVERYLLVPERGFNFETILKTNESNFFIIHACHFINKYIVKMANDFHFYSV